MTLTEGICAVRWHGRGGQGAISSAQILAHAAYLAGCCGATSAPSFGAERRGAPVTASTRFSQAPIRVVSQIEYPDIVVLLDETLLDAANVIEGLRPGGWLVVNTPREPEVLGLDSGFAVAVADATGIAREIGLLVAGAPIVNTAMLGAVAQATGVIALEQVRDALSKRFPHARAEKNFEAARRTAERTIVRSASELTPGKAVVGAVTETAGTRECRHMSAMASPGIGEAGSTGRWRTERPVVDVSKCLPAARNEPCCFRCWAYCPEAVIRRGQGITIDLEYCKGCGICAQECPTGAITMVPEGAGSFP